MATNYTVSKQDELYNVVDEMEFIIDTFGTAKEAKAFIKDLEAMENRLQHIEDEDEVEVVQEEAEVEAVEAEVEVEVVQDEVEVVDTKEEALDEDFEAKKALALAFEAVNAVETAIIVEAAVVEAVAKEGKAERKSDKVRARIALAKQQKETKEVVIAWAIAELGMKKALAKAYVEGNWNK